MPTVSNDTLDAIAIILVALAIIQTNRRINKMRKDIDRILESGWFPEPREERKDEV